MLGECQTSGRARVAVTAESPVTCWYREASQAHAPLVSAQNSVSRAPACKPPVNSAGTYHCLLLSSAHSQQDARVHSHSNTVLYMCVHNKHIPVCNVIITVWNLQCVPAGLRSAGVLQCMAPQQGRCGLCALLVLLLGQASISSSAALNTSREDAILVKYDPLFRQQVCLLPLFVTAMRQ